MALIGVLRHMSATRSGMSFGKNDMKVPAGKPKIIDEAEAQVQGIENNLRKGVITQGERYNQIIDCWTHARERIGDGQEVLGGHQFTIPSS